jgi:hypothetical protein
MITQAEAPSESCEALPAVMLRPTFTRIPSAKTGFNEAKPSRVVSALAPSSLARRTCFCDVAPLALSTTVIVVAMGAISASKRPAARAAAVRCCERNA